MTILPEDNGIINEKTQMREHSRCRAGRAEDCPLRFSHLLSLRPRTSHQQPHFPQALTPPTPRQNLQQPRKGDGMTPKNMTSR